MPIASLHELLLGLLAAAAAQLPHLLRWWQRRNLRKLRIDTTTAEAVKAEFERLWDHNSRLLREQRRLRKSLDMAQRSRLKLEDANTALRAQNSQQAAQIQALNRHTVTQEGEIEELRTQLAEMRRQIALFTGTSVEVDSPPPFIRPGRPN